MLNLDTHILVHALQGTLRRGEQKLLTKNRWSISAIVLWELAKLAQLKRITLDINSQEFTLALSRIHVWPIDLRICQEISKLDFHSDPADEIIAVTSIIHQVPLLTRDRVLLQSSVVPTAT
jgi:PIN domain nuclease of toxin-antitoxin system